MKINVKKEDFLNSLNIVSKALKKGNLYQILDCILIDASKNNIFLTCQDGKEITIKNKTEGDILEKGITAIDGSLLISIIRNMPENSDIEINVDKNRECTIICGESIKKTIQAKDETTYPNVTSVNKENKIIINELKLKKLIEKTKFSYDRNSDTTNAVLKGIYINVNKDKITAKSMDGYIISIINEIINDNQNKYETIVPGTSLEELNKLISGEVNKDVFIYFNEKNIAFEFNNTIFTSIIIPNNYIDTDRIFNIEYSTKVNINKNEFVESLIRSIPFLRENDNKPVVIDIKDDEMSISLNTMSGDSYEKLEIKKTGKDLMIAFNANYLIKVLNAIDDQNINLYFSGPKNPIIIKNKQETYSFLITPVKI
ncbi:MAG: DNA polymerase III subunit beta [Lachnospiraceae bacterium]|nr:DNA polymerase III subunit beta [Lachnospiraceae bacterium]